MSEPREPGSDQPDPHIFRSFISRFTRGRLDPSACAPPDCLERSCCDFVSMCSRFCDRDSLTYTKLGFIFPREDRRFLCLQHFNIAATRRASLPLWREAEVVHGDSQRREDYGDQHRGQSHRLNNQHLSWFKHGSKIVKYENHWGEMGIPASAPRTELLHLTTNNTGPAWAPESRPVWLIVFMALN